MTNSRLLFWSITCALAGFIFGFDLVVVSGAEQQIEKLWNLTPGQHGWAIGSAIWGALIGSLIGGFPTNKFGRKKTLAWLGVLYFISFVGSAFAWDLTSFAFFRIIGGIGIGISTVAAPIFISEISPAAQRGRLTGMFQFNIVFGLLAATLSNAAISHFVKSDDAWRWMLGVAAVPSIIYLFMCFTLPESPRWLIGAGKREEGKKVFSLINPEWSARELENKIVEIEKSNEKSSAKSGGIDFKAIRLPIMIAFLVAFFNQLSGINAILAFAPRIFGMTGIDTSGSLFNASLITLVNLVFTLVGLRLIDKLGRRTLLYIGSIGYIASLGICAWAFSTYASPFKVAAAAIEYKNASTQVTKTDLTDIRKQKAAEDLIKSRAELIKVSTDASYKGTPVTAIAETLTLDESKKLAETALSDASKQAGSGGTIVLLCILGFIAAHAIGQGTVIWVLISEIFPTRARDFGQSLGSATHWVFAALLTQFFPVAVAKFSPTVLFGFFCFMMVLHLIWVKVMVPETKGIALEDMEDRLRVH